MPQQYPVSIAHLERQASRAAQVAASAGFVHELTRQGLLERLEPVSTDARLVVDLGCGPGASLASLEKRFRGARVVGVDRSLPMLQLARSRRRWLSRAACVRCDAGALPFAAHTVDVVYSNLTLASFDNPLAIANEVNRVLRQDGLFVFATLGPDSLETLRQAWASVDDGLHVQRFPDMHDLGDLLVRAGLRDPVLDVDRLDLDYATTTALFRDLTAAGARNALAGRHAALTGKARFRRLLHALEAARAAGEPLRIGLELVYGHCWGSGRTRNNGDVRVDATTIPLRQPRR